MEIVVILFEKYKRVLRRFGSRARYRNLACSIPLMHRSTQANDVIQQIRIRLWPKIKMPSRRNLGSSRGMQVDSLPCTATGSPVSPPAIAKIVLQL